MYFKITDKTSPAYLAVDGFMTAVIETTVKNRKDLEAYVGFEFQLVCESKSIFTLSKHIIGVTPKDHNFTPGPAWRLSKEFGQPIWIPNGRTKGGRIIRHFIQNQPGIGVREHEKLYPDAVSINSDLYVFGYIKTDEDVILVDTGDTVTFTPLEGMIEILTSEYLKMKVDHEAKQLEE